MTILLTTAVVLCSQIPAADDAALQPQVVALVQQLNDDQLTTRNEAERQLLALGPRILDQLPPTTARTPEEVRSRLQRVRQALEEIAARQATRATRVTLEGKLSLSAALAALQEQTGNHLLDFRERMGQSATDPQLRLDLQDVTFWQALDTILDQAGLEIYPYSGQTKSLALQARSGASPGADRYTDYSELFRFQATRVKALRNLRNPENQGVRLTVEVCWEPRILPIAIFQSLAEMSAVANDGRELTIDDRPTAMETPVQNTVATVEIEVPFALPPRTVTQIASLKGAITALLPGRKTRFEFADLAEAREVAQRDAGVRVMLLQTRKNAELQEIRVLVRFDEADEALESHRGWVYSNDAFLLDADGKRTDYAGLETFRQRPQEVGLAYVFDVRDLANQRFVYETPAAISRVKFPFELTQIELP